MKKLLSVVFLFSLIVSSVSVTPNVKAISIPEGAIIKTDNNPDVYIVKYKNGKQFKRLVLNPQVFESYGHLKWEDILTVDQSEMDSFVVSDLVRVDGQTDIFQLVPNGDVGTKVLLESTTGYDLDLVYTINAVDFGNYIEEAPKLALIKLTGVGQQASQKFILEEGMSIFNMTHTGNENFIIWLLDSDGQQIELLVNTIGLANCSLSKAVGIDKKGEYLLDISTNGEWSVEIEQPRPSIADTYSKFFTGTGNQVSPFLKLDKGLVIFRLTHAGIANFIVELLDSNGQYIELLANEIGEFDGTKAVGISQSGLYLLNITAEDSSWFTGMSGEKKADWTIEIE